MISFILTYGILVDKFLIYKMSLILLPTQLRFQPICYRQIWVAISVSRYSMSVSERKVRRTVSDILAPPFVWHTARRTGSGLNVMTLTSHIVIPFGSVKAVGIIKHKRKKNMEGTAPVTVSPQAEAYAC